MQKSFSLKGFKCSAKKFQPQMARTDGKKIEMILTDPDFYDLLYAQLGATGYAKLAKCNQKLPTRRMLLSTAALIYTWTW